MSNPVQWRVVADNDPIGEAIKWVSRGQATHVEFCMEDWTQTIGARADGGVQVRPIHYAKFSAEWRFQAEVTEEQLNHGTKWLHAQLGKPYDFLNIAAIALDRNWQDPSKWICSKLWVEGMAAFGLLKPLDPGVVNWFTPEDSLLLSLAVFTQVNQ
jgi:uncharacterized protein YycO